MANQWYYTKGDERMGPVSSDDLKRLAASGELKPGDLIWKEGLDDWKPASQLKGLFGDSPQPATAAGAHPMYWQIALIVSAVVLIAAMFLPWWGFRMRGTQKDIEEKLTEEYEREVPRRGEKEPPFKYKTRRIKPTLASNLTSSAPWYVRNAPQASIRSNILEIMENRRDKDADLDIRVKIWGWHVTQGLCAGFLGFAVLPLAVVMMLSPAARRFSFAASFLAAYASFILVVMSLVWYFDSPGWDIGPISQGAHVGPYLALTGGVLVLVFGLLDGILGLRAFRRRL